MYNAYGGFGNQCLGTYQILNFHYDAPSRTCYYSNSPSWQCCSTTDMMNRWQMQQTMNCLQAQTQSLKNFENTEKLINSIKPIKFEEEKGEYMYYETISDYMEKDFLYESELKEIEDKFHFDFKYFSNTLNKEEKKIFDICENAISQLKTTKYENIDYVYIGNACNYLSLRMESQAFSSEVDITEKDIKIVRQYTTEEIKVICNSIINSYIPEYQQFYEKYKNRIVKDNEYEDLSYYEKILKENA